MPRSTGPLLQPSNVQIRAMVKEREDRSYRPPPSLVSEYRRESEDE